MSGFRSKRVARRAAKASVKTRQRQQLEHVASVFVHIEGYRQAGLGWRRIAAMLNTSGYSAPRGGLWYPLTAQRVYETGRRHGVQLPLVNQVTGVL